MLLLKFVDDTGNFALCGVAVAEFSLEAERRVHGLVPPAGAAAQIYHRQFRVQGTLSYQAGLVVQKLRVRAEGCLMIRIHFRDGGITSQGLLISHLEILLYRRILNMRGIGQTLE